MVMIPWNQPTKPATPVANQLYVDDQKQVWQWDDTSKAWMRKPHMYLQEIEHMSLYTAGRSWFDFVRDVYPRHLFPQWPNLYTKTFCEFSFPITSTPSVYYSHPASVEGDFRAIVRTNTPHAGIFNDECNVRIMQVVDPTMDVCKTSYHNRIYSQLRNREAFNRRHGRAAAGLPITSGYSDRFTPTSLGVGGYFSDAFDEIWVNFLQQFYGITPGSVPGTGRQIIWHHHGKSVFRQPREGSSINSGILGRYAWDVGTSSVVSVVPYNTDFTVGAPKIVSTQHSNPSVRELSNVSTMKGAGYLYSGASVMMVYPLTRPAPNLQYAFFCKPLGVDCFGFGYDPYGTPMRLVVEKVFKDGHVRRSMVNHSAAYSRGYFDQADVVTGFDLRMLELQLPMGLRANAEEIPEFVQFYLLDSDSGCRSEVIGQKYKIVRRKCHITLGVEPMRNR